MPNNVKRTSHGKDPHARGRGEDFGGKDRDEGKQNNVEGARKARHGHLEKRRDFWASLRLENRICVRDAMECHPRLRIVLVEQWRLLRLHGRKMSCSLLVVQPMIEWPQYCQEQTNQPIKLQDTKNKETVLKKTMLYSKKVYVTIVGVLLHGANIV